jgi:peptidoglycan-associated lipoprotein
VINSSANEIMPSYHFDGTTIYFSSDRKDENYKFSFYSADLADDSLLSAEDGLDRSKRENRSPSMPKVREVRKLSSPFNSKYDDEGMSLSHDGIWVYYSSNRPGGEGQFDIYRAPITDDMRKNYAFDFSGLVVDGSEGTMIGLDSSIKIYNEKGLVRLLTSKRIGGDITSRKAEGENFNFKTKLLTGYKYKIEVSSPGFNPNEFNLDLSGNIGYGKSKFVRVILMPLKEESDIAEPVISTPEKKSDSVTVQSDPKKEPSKETPPPAMSGAKVILKDFDSKRIMIEGSVKIFSDTQKDGFLLQKEKDSFVLEKIPDGAFELTGSATGYSTETLVVQKEDKTLRDKKEYEIILKKSSSKPGVFDKIVLFDFSESKIKADQIPIINEIIKHLQANLKDRVEVAGHTDNIDSKDFNVKLSQKRADVIKEYLVSKGIDEKRVETKALWYSQPLADNTTEEGRAKNRRVTFKKLDK